MLIQPLNKTHDRQGFDCGDEDLNRWFSQMARQHKDKGVSSTFVAVDNEITTEVLGFYSISLGEVINADIPTALQKRLPNKIPVFRLCRLATSEIHKGKRIGEFMLFDAIDRVTRISNEVGGAGIVVNSKPTAIDFYKKYDFEQMLDHPLNLFLAI